MDTIKKKIETSSFSYNMKELVSYYPQPYNKKKAKKTENQ